jgi:hypothetical protein
MPTSYPLFGDSVNSWDRFKVIEKVRFAADELGASNPQQLRQLISSCSDAAGREVYFGLLPFFCDRELQENHYERQKLAGTILLAVAPPSPLALDGSVYASAKYWNLSVRELPSYWCRAFGQSEVVAFLDDLVGDCAEAKLKQSVETMLFWSRRYEGENREP